MKDLLIKEIKSINQNAIEQDKMGDVVTRLYCRQGDKKICVEDFSPFANSNYMSKGLLDALANRQTLTKDQEKELNQFIIEKEMTLQ